jgi:dCTP deaminase
MVTLLDAPRFVGRDTLLEITLDDGAVIRATPDHDFMRRDGRWTAAADLRPDDSLMPLYRGSYRGDEVTYQPLTGSYDPTQRLADEWNLRNGVYHGAAGTQRHHVDHDRRNNNPWNIVRMGTSEQTRHRDSFSNGDRHGPAATSAANDDRSHPVWAAPNTASHGSGTARNHRVTRVRELQGDHDVYCLTVPEAGNFALEAGVFVSNCGIVANVTPLEPGWEGHVTLELSNTTPLPAKVYANEGIVQLLFFQGDRPETTYRDRKGKYQGQKGVTLPRI